MAASRAKVLLVEDNPVDAEMIANILRKKNHKVIVATNGRDGIRMALEEMPDLILMDMILPGMHGLEATIKLKKFPKTKDIPIIAITALHSPEFISECYDEGIDCFIRKPFSPDELYSKIEKYLIKTKREARKLMIVADDPILITMLSMSLIKKGYEVFTVPWKKNMKSEVKKFMPHLILLDGVSFEREDRAILDEFRKEINTLGTPVIIMLDSGDFEEIKGRSKGFEICEYLMKPFKSEEMMSKIKKLLKV